MLHESNKQNPVAAMVSVRLTLFIVSFTDGKGSLGSDPWKLYNFGLFHPDNTLTTLNHSFVFSDIFEPGARD